MKLHFLGANRQVTGSRYCLETDRSRVMVDCGMFQEREHLERNWDECPLPASSVDCLLLTHVHIDHCGLLPRLTAAGFEGRVFATRPSTALAEVMLRDAARIQEEDVEYKKRRHRREGRQGPRPILPLFTEADVEATLKQLQPVPYKKRVPVTEDVAATFYDAGHILGSAMLELEVREGETVRRVLFSGDIGQWGKPLIRDPSLFEAADYVVMESTYGDRDHQDGGDIETQLLDILRETLAGGGNVVIPTFAVERAQELMYYISRLVHADRIPDIPIFLDSPMAVDVTELFRQFHDCFDKDTWELINSNEPPLRFPGLQLVRSVAASKQINRNNGPGIIMATSGMCTAGRIKHHLRNNIEHPSSTILFVGYQAQGTLGRQILDGNREVRIHGRMYRVRAKVRQLYGFSGHADRGGLLRWIGHLREPPRQLFLTHGEEDAARALARQIGDLPGEWEVQIPSYREAVELL